MNVINLLPILGLSGAGKNFLIDALVTNFPEFYTAPVQYSTRNMREGETQGNPYVFISEAEYLEINNTLTAKTGYYGAQYGTRLDEMYNVNDKRIRLINADFDGWMSLVSDSRFYQSDTLHINILSLALLSAEKQIREGREIMDAFQERNIKTVADLIIYPWELSNMLKGSLDNHIDFYRQYNKDIEEKRKESKKLVISSNPNDDLNFIHETLQEFLMKRARLTI
jgi:guanylate kinase